MSHSELLGRMFEEGGRKESREGVPALSAFLRSGIMKKGLFSLLGLVAFAAIALMPATSFAAPATRAATSHKVHIFHSRGYAQPSKASSNIPYNGGAVMASIIQVYAIFWEPTGNVSANYNSLIKRYFNDVGGGPLFKINKQYTAADPSIFPSNAVLAGTLLDTTSPYPHPSPLLDSDIQNEVTHAQTVNPSWSSGTDTIFFVFTEKNEGLCVDSSQTSCTPDVPSSTNTNPFCAYHGFFGLDTVYAAMPYAASPSFNFGCTTGGNLGLTGSSPNHPDPHQPITLTSPNPQ